MERLSDDAKGPEAQLFTYSVAIDFVDAADMVGNGLFPIVVQYKLRERGKNVTHCAGDAAGRQTR
jgi:hypothetical protein